MIYDPYCISCCAGAASGALPEAERKDASSYYEDYLDAAGPENEARAIAELGSPEEVARIRGKSVSEIVG